MGTVFGRIIVRPLKNYNVENRAHKLISKDTVRPAPKYDSTYKQIELAKKVNPDYLKSSKQKDEALDESLKKVYVTTTDPGKEIDTRYDANKPLPQHRGLWDDHEYGFYEPEKIPKGKITLRKALALISKHNTNQKLYDKDYLAREYDMEPKVVDNILDHFKIYKVYQSENQMSEPQALPVSLRTGTKVLQLPKKK